jgi:predicted transcriptional regulator
MMIIRKLRETPGVCQREIASFLGITPSTVNYHMQGLLEDGLVVKERHGMRLRYFLSKKSDSVGL